MPPAESTLLSNYLLTPAKLPAIVSLNEFISMFPKSQQASPQIRALYRDLQAQLNASVDSVAANIEGESKRGKALRREVTRAKKESSKEELDDEMEIEKALAGTAFSNHQPRHKLGTVLPELETAISDLEDEIQAFRSDEEKLLLAVRQTVGNLSDLRYGKLANSHLRDQVLEGLADVQATCKRKP
ncbi:uncharacterized protein E0L32_008852 [Thyridium curvatum]|uniref:Uncharacterized protein n=1 Tax=Thyridium curvatum TaxID=1093900 RepID=A0A507AIK6_9PEZI|nr:uncharacterized protein E0L32_008852 [Thyridium curvatum]TPX10005.1 hypothetical protein E0L32_008852 [Thyridium curvatum]